MMLNIVTFISRLNKKKNSNQKINIIVSTIKMLNDSYQKNDLKII